MILNKETMTKKSKNVGGIWINKSKAGKTMLGISIEIEGKQHKFVAFKNDYKEGIAARPDWTILQKMEPTEQPKTAQPSQPEHDDLPF